MSVESVGRSRFQELRESRRAERGEGRSQRARRRRGREEGEAAAETQPAATPPPATTTTPAGTTSATTAVVAATPAAATTTAVEPTKQRNERIQLQIGREVGFDPRAGLNRRDEAAQASSAATATAKAAQSDSEAASASSSSASRLDVQNTVQRFEEASASLSLATISIKAIA